MTSFKSACFSGRVNLKQIQEKSAQGGTEACSPKNFKLLHGVMVFLVLFEQILIKFSVPHSKSFTKYGAFCSHIFDLCVLTSSHEWIQKILVGGCNFELG